MLARLRETFDVADNQADAVHPPEALAERLQGRVGLLANAADAINADLIARVPTLRAVANMAVGYNNLDLPAMTRAGILATNTPDILTETTADFGWALLMAAARRVPESGAGCARATGSAGRTTCFSVPRSMAARWASSAWGASARRWRGARAAFRCA